MNLGGFEQWLYLILIIVCILPVFLGVGAAMEGNWGTMVLLFALGGGLMLVFQAIGL